MSFSVAPGSRCWGEALCDGSPNRWYGRRHASMCTGTGRSAGKKNATFKDRFCVACCRDGVMVPTSMVRAMIAPTSVPFLQNSRSAGCAWSVGHVSGCPPFRVVNHTNACNGPQLVIFDSVPTIDGVEHVPHAPSAPQWHPILHASLVTEGSIRWIVIPVAWLSADGQFIHMCVAHGTLVPRDHIGSRRAPIAGPVVRVPSMSSMFDAVRGKRSYSVCFPYSCTPGVSPSDTNVASACDVARAGALTGARADSIADFIADSGVDSRTNFRDDLPDVARRTRVCRATDTYCDTYADTDTVSLLENRSVVVAVPTVNTMDPAFAQNNVYGKPVRSVGCVQVSAPAPTPEPTVPYPLSAPSAPPPRASAPFNPSESDTELFASDSEVELHATGDRRDESAIHSTTTEGSFCRRSACQIDPVESRMRGIAVLAMLELNANRSVPHPALH